MARFPVSFNFRAFDRMGTTVDSINRKFRTLRRTVRGVNNRFVVMERSTRSLTRSLERAGRTFSRVGRDLTTFVTLPLVALGARFVKVSADAEETANKFKEVFKEVDDAAKTQSVKVLTDQFKLSTRNAQDFLSTTGLIAKGLDLNSEQALELSTTLASLSQDVASFRNVQGGARRVVESFNSALVGERERLKTLGIVITEADVKAKALELTQKGQTFETVKQAKAFATLALIQERVKDDIGDFQRTIGSFSNQLRVTAERFDEVSKIVGDILKPVVADLLAVVNKLQEGFLNLSPEAQKFVVIGLAIVAAVGPLILIFGKIIGAIGFMITGFQAMAALGPALGVFFKVVVGGLGLAKVAVLALGKGLLLLAANPIGLVVTGIGLLIAGVIRIVTVWDELVASFKAGKTVLESIGNVFKTFFGFGDEKKATLVVRKEQSDAEETGRKATDARVLGRAFAQEIRTTQNASVRVDFRNAPRGTRVATESPDGADVGFNLGFAGGF